MSPDPQANNHYQISNQVDSERHASFLTCIQAIRSPIEFAAGGHWMGRELIVQSNGLARFYDFFQVMLLAAQISSKYQDLHLSGLPDKQATRKLSPYLSAELIASITRARQRQAQCISAHPGEKGPWVEGDVLEQFRGAYHVSCWRPQAG